MNLLKIEWLDYFSMLAKCLSFSIAAKNLGISQQVLSYNIQQLENHLGYEVVERSHEGIKLSYSGKLLLEKSEYILQQIRFLEKNHIKMGNQNEKPKFLVGLSIWYPYILDPFIFQLSASSQFLLSINKIVDSSEKLQEAVLQRHLDMALVCQKIDHPMLVSRFVTSSKSVIVANQNTPKPWHEWSYIQLESNLNSLMFWPEIQYPRNIVAKASSIAAVMMCQDGMGALMIPDISVSEYLKEGSLFIVAEPPIEHQFDCYLIWHKNQKYHSLLDEQYDRVFRKTLPDHI